jgi:hypothetical protein
LESVPGRVRFPVLGRADDERRVVLGVRGGRSEHGQFAESHLAADVVEVAAAAELICDDEVLARLAAVDDGDDRGVQVPVSGRSVEVDGLDAGCADVIDDSTRPVRPVGARDEQSPEQRVLCLGVLRRDAC